MRHPIKWRNSSFFNMRYVMAQKSDEVRKREALSNGFATYMRLSIVMQSETSANVSPVMQTPAQV